MYLQCITCWYCVFTVSQELQGQVLVERQEVAVEETSNKMTMIYTVKQQLNISITSLIQSVLDLFHPLTYKTKQLEQQMYFVW